MNKFKRFMKNTKAISPIFATLILIAIAVIAGVVVYMFTSGFLAGNATNTNAAQEKVAVSGAQYNGGTVTAYVQNMQTTGTVTVTGLLVKDSTGNTIAATGVSGDSPNALGPETFAQTDGLITFTGTATVPSAGTYTLTVTTEGGGSFVSPAFTVTTP